MSNPYSHWQWRLKSRFGLKDSYKHEKEIKDKIAKEDGFLIEQTENKTVWIIVYNGNLMKVVLDKFRKIKTVMSLNQKERDFWKRETLA